RFDRRERVVDLVANDANEPLPRLALLVAQRPADVGEDEELVRAALLPEGRAPHFPASAAAGKRRVGDARRRAFEVRGQIEIVGAAAQELVGRLAKEALARTIDEPQPLRAVEGEDRDV